ncbi:MAG: hypothetical protein ACXIUB_11495 [Wenzhouxiangella sp.]
MSEVLLLLKLRRRSGVLAAAVAAVHKAGLTFKSQQPRELDGAPALLLTTESDSVPDYDAICGFMAAVSGVDSVIEILVDGSPLLPIEASADSVFDEGRGSTEPMTSGAADDSPWSLGEEALAPDPQPELESPAEEPLAATEEEPEPAIAPSARNPVAVETEGEPAIEWAARPEPESELKTEAAQNAATPPVERPINPVAEFPPPSASKTEAMPGDEPESESDAGGATADQDEQHDESSGREMTRAMKRRWRRYR